MARALLATTLVLAACAGQVPHAPHGTSPAAPTPGDAPPPSAPAAAADAPAAPRAPDNRTVINFEEDTGGALPDGPELDVVNAKTKAKFRSLIDPKYRRGDGGVAPGAGAAEPAAEE